MIKYRIDSYFVDIFEDDYKDGYSIHTFGGWDNDDLPIRGEFDTIEDTLKALCKQNCFDFSKDIFDLELEQGTIKAFTSFLVDKDNAEASKYEIEQWKQGKMKLYSADFVIRISKIETKAIEAVEIKNW